jgi:hypothetical protein
MQNCEHCGCMQAHVIVRQSYVDMLLLCGVLLLQVPTPVSVYTSFLIGAAVWLNIVPQQPTQPVLNIAHTSVHSRAVCNAAAAVPDWCGSAS